MHDTFNQRRKLFELHRTRLLAASKLQFANYLSKCDIAPTSELIDLCKPPPLRQFELRILEEQSHE